MYDEENRLIAVNDNAPFQRWSYGYDFRGRRISKASGSGVTSETRVVFSGGTSCVELGTTGDGSVWTPTVEFVRGVDRGGGIGGLLYSIRSGGNRRYSHYNGRGDVVSQTDTDGIATWQASYEAFGMHQREAGVNPDTQRANTKEEDPTGLLNEGFRYRDLETGTFITRDPAGFVDGPNLCTYVRQNPWSKFDPEGLAEEDASRLPRHSGADRTGYFIGKPGESTFFFDSHNNPKLAEKYSKGIPFVGGRPDFSGITPGEVSARSVKIKTTYEVNLTGDTKKDTNQVRDAIRDQLRKELKLSYKDADKLMRETLSDFRLHHHLDTNEIKLVPADAHGKIAHYGERAATAGRIRGGRGIGKGLALFAFAEALEDPGSVLAAPFGGATQMGDATIDGYQRTRLHDATDPSERLDRLRWAKDNSPWDFHSGYKEELNRREGK